MDEDYLNEIEQIDLDQFDSSKSGEGDKKKPVNIPSVNLKKMGKSPNMPLLSRLMNRNFALNDIDSVDDDGVGSDDEIYSIKSKPIAKMEEKKQKEEKKEAIRNSILFQNLKKSNEKQLGNVSNKEEHEKIMVSYASADLNDNIAEEKSNVKSELPKPVSVAFAAHQDRVSDKIS